MKVSFFSVCLVGVVLLFLSVSSICVSSNVIRNLLEVTVSDPSAILIPSDPVQGLWLENRQRQLTVTQTTVSPAGHIIDWVPMNSQVTGPIGVPPPQTNSPTVSDPTRVMGNTSFDIGEAGPAGHVPIKRPNLSLLSQPGLTGISKELYKTGGAIIRNASSPEGGTPTNPNPANYFHDGSAQNVNCYGADAWLNLWEPTVDIPSSPGDDHSISQVWLLNTQKGYLQTLEAGWTVDHSLNGNAAPHLFTYYTTNGYTADGNNIGGYNRLQSGWVQYHPTIYPGIQINGISVQGGTQYEFGIKYQLYQGNWWFGFNNVENGPWIWLGYYPASLFNGGVGNIVQQVQFGGEVYSALAATCSTTDQMGSGRHAADGWTHACYQRNLEVQTTTSGTMANFNGFAFADTAIAGCSLSKYTGTTFMNSGSSWGSYQYFGGPAS